MRVYNCMLLIALLGVGTAAGQPRDAVRAHFQEIENELDRSVVALQINRLSDQIVANFHKSGVSSIAVVPFRNSDGKRTGLTEYLGYHLGMALKNQAQARIISAARVSEDAYYLQTAGQFSIPRDAVPLAYSVSAQWLLFGTTMVGSDKINFKGEIYDTAAQTMIQSYTMQLPRTAELLAMDRQTIVETQLTEVDKPAPDEPPPAIHPVAVPERPLQNPDAPLSRQSDLDSALEMIAGQLVATAMIPAETRVGLLDFLDLQGRTTQLGGYMTEELTTLLFTKGRFNMVERSLLDQVLREQGLTQTGVIDIAQAQAIGKALGADAIVTGSLSDVGEEIKVNARMIHVGQGTLLAVASAAIYKTPQVVVMFNTQSRKNIPPPRPSAVQEPVPPSAPSGYSYFEDFQNIQDGMLPDGWIGGEKLMVKSEANRKFVTNFENDQTHRVTIDNLVFPDDYELEYIFRFSNEAFSTHLYCILPNIRTTIDVFGWYQLNESRVEKKIDFRNKTVKAVLRKSGPIYRLIINGEEVLLARNPDAATPQALTFEFQNMNGFRLMEISIKSLQ